MIKSIKTGIILLAALLLAWLLPWCYAFVFASPSWSPFTLYSCVTHGFASVDFDRENNVAGRDLQGNTYTQQQFDSILPTFYYRQLAAEGRFPSEIEGVAVESRDVERTNFMFRTSPGEINRRRPTVYQLLESMPDRIDLEPATDVFRITGEGIEFVDMETNTIDQKKSAAFTKVLRDKGFSFPARVVSGNPSTRKRYDNGYLLVDDALRVYHMKQDFRALDMAKKLMPKAGSLRRTLYKARDIRHYKAVPVTEIYNAKVRIQGREMVVCDLRSRIGNAG